MKWKKVDEIEQKLKPQDKLLVNGLKFIRQDQRSKVF
jgi:hypothetical protein